MNRMGRLLAIAWLCAAMVAACAAPGVAEASLGAYAVEMLSGGGTRYVFDEVAVTTPDSWKGKFVVLEYGERAAFCHESSNRLWRQENGHETGGLLFELCVSQTTDFRNEPAYQELGRTDRGYYYLSFPTDVQAYADDEVAAREYMALWAYIDDVRQSAELLSFHAGPGLSPAAGMPEGTKALTFDEGSAPYAGEWVPFEDGFKLYVPVQWRSFELSEAEVDAGIFYRSGNGAMGAAVSYFNAGALKTQADLARDFERAGFSDVQRLNLNGIEAVAFDRPSDDYRGVAFYHPSYPGYALVVYASPMDEAVAAALLSSVSPYAVP